MRRKPKTELDPSSRIATTAFSTVASTTPPSPTLLTLPTTGTKATSLLRLS